MPRYVRSNLPERTGATFRPPTQAERNFAFFNPFQAWTKWNYAESFDEWWWKLVYFFAGDFEFNKTETPPGNSPEVARKISHVGLLDWLLLLPVLLKAAHYFSEFDTVAWRVMRFLVKCFDSITYYIVTLPVLYVLRPLLILSWWLYGKTVWQFMGCCLSALLFHVLSKCCLSSLDIRFYRRAAQASSIYLAALYPIWAIEAANAPRKSYCPCFTMFSKEKIPTAHFHKTTVENNTRIFY